MRNIGFVVVSLVVCFFLISMKAPCAVPFLSLDPNLSKEVREEVFEKLTTQEAIFLKVVFSSDNAESIGSIDWIGCKIEEYLQSKTDNRVVTTALLTIFKYPTGKLPADYPSGSLFANLDQVQARDSRHEYTEWVNIARVIDDEASSVRAVIRFMVWVSEPSGQNKGEDLLAFTSEFELKEDKWILKRVKIHKPTE